MQACPNNVDPLTLPYRGIHYFLILGLKHTLRVLDRMNWLLRVPTIYVLRKNKKTIKFSHLYIICLQLLKTAT